MTGAMCKTPKTRVIFLAGLSLFALAGCDQSSFSNPFGAAEPEPAPFVAANARNQAVQPGVDVERPDIFSVTDRGLWDGRPSLGGVWVAHPDVRDPDRVVIRNTENGRSTVGALFRRERENPGPLLQVSSDAAEQLGILAGAPTELNVVVLRRDQQVIEQQEEVAANPVTSSLEAPVAVEAETLEPAETTDESNVAETAATAATAAAAVADVATDALPTRDVETATVADDQVDVSSILSPAAAALPGGAMAQVGIYSVEANANADAARIVAAGIEARVDPQTLGGRTVWGVLAGPLADAGQVSQLRQMGFVDAFIQPQPDATSEEE